MKKCKYCQTEIDDKAKVCPNCRKKQGMPKWVIAIIVIIVIAIVGSAAGGSSDSSKGTSKEKTNTTTKQEALVLEEGHTGSPDEYGMAYYIEGYIKNTSSKEFSYVQVEFTSYDSEGNTLGTCLDNNSGLEASGRWKFKAICTSDADKIASYKLKEITKW